MDNKYFTKWLSKKVVSKGSVKFKYPLDFYTSPHNTPPEDHQFFSELKPLIYALAAFGRFPFRLDSEKRLKSCILSYGGLYWTVAYLLMTIIAYNLAGNWFALILNSHDREEALTAVKNSFFLLAHVFMPLNWLSEWRGLAEYINEWDEFLVEWKRLTGVRLDTGLRLKAVITVVVYPIFVLVSAASDTSLGTISGQFLFWWSVCGGFFHSSMFLLSLLLTKKISNHLKNSLISIVGKSKNHIPVSAAEVRLWKYLWVRGTDLLVKSGNAMGLSCLVIYWANTAVVVVSLYGMITKIIVGDFQGAYYYMYLVLCCASYVVVGCEIAHQASRMMGDDIFAALATVDVSGLNEITAKEACSHIITYLIILVQFNNSA